MDDGGGGWWGRQGVGVRWDNEDEEQHSALAKWSRPNRICITVLLHYLNNRVVFSKPGPASGVPLWRFPVDLCATAYHHLIATSASAPEPALPASSTDLDLEYLWFELVWSDRPPCWSSSLSLDVSQNVPRRVTSSLSSSTHGGSYTEQSGGPSDEHFPLWKPSNFPSHTPRPLGVRGGSIWRPLPPNHKGDPPELFFKWTQ